MLRQPKNLHSQRLRIRSRAVCHKLLGRLLFRCGRLSGARRHFEQVLDLRGDDFLAYVHLGRIAYKLGDYAGWRRECGHARRTAPERFARLRHPFELFEGRTDWEAGWDGEEQRLTRGPGTESSASRTGRRVADRTRREPRDQDLACDLQECDVQEIDAEEASGQPIGNTSGAQDQVSDSGRGSDRCVDDFASGRERRAFRERGPIAIEELQAVDLDELARQLSE